MQNLARKFINENEENKTLYKKTIIECDDNAYSTLNEGLENYLFKIYATSYLYKSIVLNSREVKRKYLKIYKREELTLNMTDINFKEERIDSIPGKPIDLIEEIINTNNIDFTEMFSDKALVFAINSLTDRQKEILYLRFVKELEEKEIAKKLEVSIQAVNKAKKGALLRIRKQLGGVKNELF